MGLPSIGLDAVARRKSALGRGHARDDLADERRDQVTDADVADAHR